MKDFDELLDGVLREDGVARPREGLEGRVMARVRANGQRSVWRFGAWGAVAAALPVCVIALLIWPRSVAPRQAPRQRTERVHGDAISALPRDLPVDALRTQRQRNGSTKTSIRQKSTTIARTPELLPKLDVFPAPSVATEPVRKMVEISRQGKIVMGLAGLSAEHKDTEGHGDPEVKIEPITIAKIEIKPL